MSTRVSVRTIDGSAPRGDRGETLASEAGTVPAFFVGRPLIDQVGWTRKARIANNTGHGVDNEFAGMPFRVAGAPSVCSRAVGNWAARTRVAGLYPLSAPVARAGVVAGRGDLVRFRRMVGGTGRQFIFDGCWLL